MTVDDLSGFLSDFYGRLRLWLAEGEKLLVHQEELGDRLQGAMAGYLVYARLIPAPAQAIAVVEAINQRQMGPPGRELVAVAVALQGHGR